jgi:three-Cys-motif partner protein
MARLARALDVAWSAPRRESVAMAVPKTTMWAAEPHTLAKHAVLRGYLEAWFPILARYQGRLVYYDGFAGPGRYSRGEPGSPVIALEVATHHRTKLASELVFSFVENRADRADHLERVEIPALGLPPNFKTEVLRSDFEAALSRTLDHLDKHGLRIAPTFAFIDPFGIKGLPFSLVRRLLARPRCEVLITFMTETIQRFVTQLPEHVNALIGRPDAFDLIEPATDRVLAARRLYEASLRDAARFVRFFHMRDRNDVPIYDLFFASNNDLGHYKMKEAMWRVDETGSYSFSDGVDPAQAVLFTAEPARRFAQQLWDQFRGKTVDATDVIQYTRDESAYLEKHARDALKLMEAAEDAAVRRILVDETRADGTRRRGKTFAPGTRVTFLD